MPTIKDKSVTLLTKAEVQQYGKLPGGPRGITKELEAPVTLLFTDEATAIAVAQALAGQTKSKP